MSNAEVTATTIVETEFGEKAALDTDFAVKDYLNALPWGEEDNYDESRLSDANDRPDFTFESGFAAHQRWNPDESRWEVDAEALPVLEKYFEAAGFEVDFGNVMVNNTL